MKIRQYLHQLIQGYALHAALAAILAIALLTPQLHAKPVVAFGYLTNTTDNQNYDYLETIFPNSFASSIEAIFYSNVLKPHRVNEILKEKHDSSLQKNYRHVELPDVIDKLNADLFIYGNFTPLAGNRIKIELHLYARGSNEIFTFTNIGKMETEIFKLVDRITLIVVDFMDADNLFMARPIKPGEHIGIITNLEDLELQHMYAAFMEKGHPVISVQGNEIIRLTEDRHVKFIDTFKFIRTVDNSYDTITDWRKTELYYGPWAGIRYNKIRKKLKDIYYTYDVHYLDVKSEIMDKLYNAYGQRLDILCIIGFNEDRDECWVRAIDMRDKRLIWMQSNVKTGMLSANPVKDITDKLIEQMHKERKQPFEK